MHNNLKKGSFIFRVPSGNVLSRYLDDDSSDDGDGGDDDDDVDPAMYKPALIHGWIMWAAWGILGFIQLASNRYMKMFWMVHMWIHIIVGSLIILITIGVGIVGIYVGGWELMSDSIHDIFGQISFFAIVVVALTGIIARDRQLKSRWRTDLTMGLKKLH